MTDRLRRRHPVVERGQPDLAAELDAGLAGLALPLTDHDRRRLLDYLALLSKWNAVYNLTAVRDPAAMLTQHLLDCLAILEPLNRRGPYEQAIDVGSGGGLPGVILAIAWPQTRLILVEPVGKKAAFLQQCISELALTHAKVLAKPIESVPLEPVDGQRLIICRAYASLAAYLRSIAHLAGPATRVAAMKGRFPDDEIAALPSGWQLDEAIELQVPKLEARRHLVWLARSTPGTTGPDES